MTLDPAAQSHRLSTTQISAGRNLLDAIADIALPIADERLRHLLIATAELRKFDPRLAGDVADGVVFFDAVRLLSTGENPPEPERRDSAVILAAIFRGAAAAIDRGERTFHSTLDLLNARYGSDPTFISASNAFDFASQSRSAGFTPTELATIYTPSAIRASEADPRERALIECFLGGYHAPGGDTTQKLPKRESDTADDPPGR